MKTDSAKGNEQRRAAHGELPVLFVSNISDGKVSVLQGSQTGRFPENIVEIGLTGKEKIGADLGDGAVCIP